MSETLLLAVITAIVLILLAMALLITARKAWRQARAAYARHRRRELEPALLRYLGERGGTLRDFLQVPARGARRAVAIELLLDHADLLKGEARERITTALEQIGMVSDEIRRLRSPSSWRRAVAAERLGLARSTLAVDFLVERLEDPDGEVRMRAARALGQIRGHLAVRPLIAALSQPSRWSALRVADILAGMGAEAEEELIRAYPRMSPAGRVAALDILGRMCRPGSASFIVQRLRDEEPDVRARAAHALGQIGDPTCYRPLVEAMRDPEWPVRAMAAKALGRMRVPQSVQALTEGLRDRQWWVRSNSALALIEAGEPGAGALLAALDSADDYARHQAVLMLQQSGLVDRYVDQICREDPEGALARQVIVKMVETGSVARLQELAAVHPFESVRTALAGTLRPATAGAAGDGA